MKQELAIACLWPAAAGGVAGDSLALATAGRAPPIRVWTRMFVHVGRRVVIGVLKPGTVGVIKTYNMPARSIEEPLYLLPRQFLKYRSFQKDLKMLDFTNFSSGFRLKTIEGYKISFCCEEQKGYS